MTYRKKEESQIRYPKNGGTDLYKLYVRLTVQDIYKDPPSPKQPYKVH